MTIYPAFEVEAEATVGQSIDQRVLILVVNPFHSFVYDELLSAASCCAAAIRLIIQL